MGWLDRLKALPRSDCALPTHRQNRQNPGSVSFDSAQVAEGFASESGAGSDPEGLEGAREAFEERAAIMEYDGGLSQADAEQAARAYELEYQCRFDSGKQRAGDGSAGGDAGEFRAMNARAREGGGSLDPVASQLDEWGDMRPCTWCRNLMRSGRCMAAWRGELRAARDYAPTFPEQPRRCYFYDPRGSDPDMSAGRERWPELASWQIRVG